jgi:DNA-binding transcriptional LysR family regulator
METERCRALLCAIEEGSLTAAAEKLGYTASGISRMMAALEEETGFPLLVRGREGVVPTEECCELLPVMRQILAAAGVYEQTASEIRGLTRGTIRIGTSYYAYYKWFAELIADFRKEYPGISVEIIDGTSTELLQAMDNHMADLCIISKRPGSYDWVLLKKDQLLACVPEKHPMAGRKRFPVSSFAEEDYIELYPGKETDNSQMFQRHNITPKVRYATSDNYAGYAMVAAGLGVACTNAIIAESFTEGVRYLPLTPAQIVEIGIATPKEKLMSPAAKKFSQFAIARFR